MPSETQHSCLVGFLNSDDNFMNLDLIDQSKHDNSAEPAHTPYRQIFVLN